MLFVCHVIGVVVGASHCLVLLLVDHIIIFTLVHCVVGVVHGTSSC
jgi:hypothetical protein